MQVVSQKNWIKKRWVLVGVAVGMVVGLAGCTKKSDDVIKVGYYGSMTGAEATFGLSTRDGVMLAIDEVNNAGGVNGKKINVIAYDNQGRPEEARLTVEKLINSDNVVALIGEVASTRSLAAAPIAQQNKVPMISPSSTNPKVTEVGDYIFRVCFIDPFQGEVMAKFAINSLKLKKAAVLVDQKSDYSVGLADFFEAKFKALGGEIVGGGRGKSFYTAGDVDFKAQLTTFRDLGADFIFVPGYYTDVGLIAKQARQLGLNIPLLGGDGWDSSKLFEIGESAINGGYFSNHYTAEDPRPEVQEFVQKFKAKYNTSPDGLAAQGYDAALVLIDALKRSGSTEGPKLRDAIASTKNFKGVTGTITLNEKRDAVKSAVVLQVDGPRFKFVESIAP